MATKYWQVTLQGQKSADEVTAAVGRGGANIVRIHVEGGRTQVYLAGDASLDRRVADLGKSPGGAHEVQLTDVMRLSSD